MYGAKNLEIMSDGKAPILNGQKITLSKKDWDILRNKCYANANYICEICGFEADELDEHEVWDFDIKNKTQSLKKNNCSL